MPDDYADNLLKGIPNKKHIIGKSVEWTAFVPPTGKAINGWRESSINWEDDEGAVDELLMRTKNDGFHFKGGAVRIPRLKVDGIIEHFQAHDRFSYERKAEETNKYHGNLLFSENITSELKTTICGALSGAVASHIKQKGE